MTDQYVDRDGRPIIVGQLATVLTPRPQDDVVYGNVRRPMMGRQFQVEHVLDQGLHQGLVRLVGYHVLFPCSCLRMVRQFSLRALINQYTQVGP